MIKFGADNNIDFPPFLVKSVEKQNNDISFIVSLAIRGEEKTVNSNTNTPVLNNTYEIIFENYVLHMTRNESYTSWYNDEIRHGNSFIIFEKSRLLNNIYSFVDLGLVEAIYPNSCKHYGIYCENHIVDVITVYEPIIKPYVE